MLSIPSTEHFTDVDKLNYLQFAYSGLILEFSQYFFYCFNRLKKAACFKKSGHKEKQNKEN